MARQSRYSVVGRLDMASRMTRGTVTINREAGLFTVRPLRRRKLYELPLSDVATMVCQRIVKAEIFQKRLAKAAKKSGRRAGR